MTGSPSADLDLERIAGELSAALVSDVMDALGHRRQCLGSGIAPLTPGAVVAGRAFPVAIRRVAEIPATPFSGLLAALDAVSEGQLFITPTARATDIAVWGELLSTATRQRGGVGALTDGLVRDSRAIRRMGFPVFCAGTIPYDSLGRHEIVEHGVPAMIDGVRIAPGDLVIADDDGVAVVPSDRAVEVVDEALAKRRRESGFLSAVAGGMSAVDAYARFDVL